MRFWMIFLCGALLASEGKPPLFPDIPCAKGVCDPDGMFWMSEVSALCWQARVEGLAFALKNDPLPNGAVANVNGKLSNVKFNFEPAFKIDIGMIFSKRGWDTEFRWTRFQTDASKTVESNGAQIIPLWVFPSADITGQFLYAKARGDWDLNFNGFDVEMGYHPFLSPALSLRFHAGLKVGSIDQKFSAHYSQGSLVGSNALVSANADLTNKTIGTGPRIGFESKWGLGKGFSLLGAFASALPLWHFRVNRTDTDQNTQSSIASGINSLSRMRFWIFRPVLEAALGLGWQTCFGCERQFPFGLDAKYELQYFAEQNMMAMLVNPGLLNQTFFPRGDLIFHGATLTFYFGF